MEPTPFDMDATGVVDLQAAASTRVGEGRYSLKRILGRGGMGIVWLAYDERLQCEVALKFLPPQIRFDPAAVDDLRRETARSRKLSHPNIIRIHDLYEPEGQDAFISMEYVEGSNLQTLRVQQAERVLSWQFLEPLVQQLCEALEYAHGQGIIHRDLKPANLMVDKAGKLKLSDFGIARAVTDTMSRSSIAQTSGTLLYMSPQQLDGGFPKVTDDIYGTGATLYELLTSKPPFFSGDLLNQVRNVPAKPLHEFLGEIKLVNKIPSHVEEVILACLNKIPSRRPQNARELAEWFFSGQRPGLLKPRRGILSTLKTFGRPNLRYVAAATVATMLAMAVPWILVGWNNEKVAARSSASPTSGSPTQPVMPQQTRHIPDASRSASAPVDGTGKPLTALQLLRKGNTHVSERSKNKVVQILSSRSPIHVPPQQWRIIYYDPKARYKSVEVQFEGGKMSRVFEPARLLEVLTPQAQKPLDAEKLRVDSSDALRITLALPEIRHLTIRSVEFALERGYGGSPVWKIQLFGAASSDPSRETGLGYAIVLADDGRVLKETFSKKTVPIK